MEKTMPRKKVEIIIEFECGELDDLDDAVEEAVRAIEDTLPEATNVFGDIMSSEDIG
jgi:hypothetical protein